MTTRKESVEYTLYGDLDGMTVAKLREMLNNYPDSAIIRVRSENIYSFGYDGRVDDTKDVLVFVWND